MPNATPPRGFRLTYNYRHRRWRTCYIIAVTSAACLTFDSLWAGVFVALATIDVEPHT